MKKIILMFLSFTVVISSVFATSDYEKGYLDGYAAGKSGKENVVQIGLDEKASNLSDLGVWDIKYYVDDFGEPTKTGYITGKSSIYGTFSNSATTNSKLKFYFIIDDEVALKLFEYGSHVVKGNSSRPDKYYVNIKCDNITYNFNAKNYGDRLIVDESEEFINILRKEKPIIISVKENSSYSSSSYLIKDIETTGFNEAMKQLFNK